MEHEIIKPKGVHVDSPQSMVHVGVFLPCLSFEFGKKPWRFPFCGNSSVFPIWRKPWRFPFCGFYSILLFGTKPWRFPSLRKFSSTFPIWEDTVAVFIFWRFSGIFLILEETVAVFLFWGFMNISVFPVYDAVWAKMCKCGVLWLPFIYEYSLYTCRCVFTC